MSSSPYRSFPPALSRDAPHAATAVELGRASSFSAGGLDASDRGRMEAERRDLEAQIAASATLHRNTLARMEAERAEWEAEKGLLRAEAEKLRQENLRVEGDARQQAHAARMASAALTDSRAEVAKLKEARQSLEAELGEVAAGGGGDSFDREALAAAREALAQDLQGKLDRSEAHRQEVARKLGKARKNQQNLLSQYEAEIAHLAEKVEMLEDEVGDVMQEKLDLQSAHEQDRERLAA